MPHIALQAGQIFEIARIGELVEIDDRLINLLEPVEDKIRADESG